MDFSVCVNIGEPGYILAEYPEERYTIYTYVVYGNGRLGKVFDSDYINLNPGDLINTKRYINDKVIFESFDNFFIIGFNVLDKSDDWGGKIITSSVESFKPDHSTSYLICFNGNPSVNDIKFKRYDYSLMDTKKEYKISIKNKEVFGYFWKK